MNESFVSALSSEHVRGMQSTGVFSRGPVDRAFRSTENFQHLMTNINQILSHEYNAPVVVDPQLLEGVMRHYSYNYEPHTTCSLNKRVIAKIRNLMRDDQHDIRIANEWEDEAFDVLSHNEDTVYNPIPVPIRTEETHPVVWVEM
jgi:hypothetical protein